MEWEEKWHHCEEELKHVSSELEHCREELFEWKDRCHHYEDLAKRLAEELTHCEDELHYLKEECYKNKHIAKVRFAKFADRIIHLSKTEDEIRDLFVQMEEMCRDDHHEFKEEIHYTEIVERCEVLIRD